LIINNKSHFVGVKTIFAGSACFDLVTSDGLGTSIISGHFDRRIRFWDTRSDNSVNEISLQGRITSLDLLPGKVSSDLLPFKKLKIF
jgi:WD40 repeat protein